MNEKIAEFENKSGESRSAVRSRRKKKDSSNQNTFMSIETTEERIAHDQSVEAEVKLIKERNPEILEKDKAVASTSSDGNNIMSYIFR